MSVGQRTVRVTRVSRITRGRRPDRNPLRRTSDRVETAVLAVLIIAFLAAAPLAGQAAGACAHARAHEAQLAEQASWRQVPALVLNVTTGVQGDGGYAGLESQGQARWTAPDGKVITGEIPVPPGTVAGSTVRSWVTGDGQLTDSPLKDSQVAGEAVLAGTVSVIALAVLLAITGMLARRALDKRRMAAWDAEWRANGPRWTTRA